MILGSELRSDQLRFSQLFANLAREGVFRLRDVESVVDRIRDSVAEQLWKLLVEDSDLVAHLQVGGANSMCGYFITFVHVCVCRLEFDQLIFLQIIKDFFLLGRGELFLTFFDLAHSFLKSAPTPTTSHGTATLAVYITHTTHMHSDMNIAFQQAMLKVGIEKEELMKQFQLTLPQTKAVRGGSGRDQGGKEAWQLLGMSHTVEWPLHILFTPLVLEK